VLYTHTDAKSHGLLLKSKVKKKKKKIREEGGFWFGWGPKSSQWLVV
jgi:hypothetical protein